MQCFLRTRPVDSGARYKLPCSRPMNTAPFHRLHTILCLFPGSLFSQDSLIHTSAPLQPSHVPVFFAHQHSATHRLGAVTPLANAGHAAKWSVIPTKRPSDSFNDTDIYGSRESSAVSGDRAFNGSVSGKHWFICLDNSCRL